MPQGGLQQPVTCSRPGSSVRPAPSRAARPSVHGAAGGSAAPMLGVCTSESIGVNKLASLEQQGGVTGLP